jgi:hypothetical protein
VLVGKDGSAIGVEGHDVAVEAPIGEYRVGMVTVVAEDAKKGEAWSFVFSGNDRDHGAEWRAVARDAEIGVDPIGELDFAAGLDFEPDSVHAGDNLVVRPLLHTHGGLLINSCARGSSTVSFRDTMVARTLLVARDGTVLDQASSGFA